MCNSFQKVVKLQTGLKIESVRLVNKFTCIYLVYNELTK